MCRLGAAVPEPYATHIGVATHSVGRIFIYIYIYVYIYIHTHIYIYTYVYIYIYLQAWRGGSGSVDDASVRLYIYIHIYIYIKCIPTPGAYPGGPPTGDATPVWRAQMSRFFAIYIPAGWALPFRIRR